MRSGDSKGGGIIMESTRPETVSRHRSTSAGESSLRTFLVWETANADPVDIEAENASRAFLAGLERFGQEPVLVLPDLKDIVS